MIASLIVIPILAAVACLLIRDSRPLRAILMATATVHLILTGLCWVVEPGGLWQGWLALDEAGKLFLTIVSILFAGSALYLQEYFCREANSPHESESVFIACLQFFLATMTLVTVSRHFSLLWVAIEATTLASAPLIYFHRSPGSLEATWKYLLICSVGIALALLGTFLLAAAGTAAPTPVELSVADLTTHARDLDPAWLKAAFLFLLVGYGTKMGLAPMHSWLPDAHSEAPSAVSALLSGALLNCAFLGIFRTLQICTAAGIGKYAGDILIAFGLISMGCAAIFLLRQVDYKRMLAYSSVEHMGILTLGIGLGGLGSFAGLLHAVNHSLTKAALFLLAGNIIFAYRTKSIESVSGLFGRIPATAILWAAGFFAIVGSPPFGTFVSELTILRAALQQGHGWIAATYLGCLSLALIGMAGVVLKMVYGPSSSQTTVTEHRNTLIPPLVFMIVVLVLGVMIPSVLGRTLAAAAALVGGTAP